MPRLSSYLLAFATATSLAWAENSVPWRKYRTQGVSQAYYCPEQVGEEKWECDNDFCGGEHPKKKGHCSLVILQGKNDVPNQHIMNKPLYCKCGPKSGGGVKPPPIIPFPPPPPGFIPPPVGVPHPKNKDSCPEDFTETKCEDCKPKSGWCTEGPKAGCPCRDKCPPDDSDDVPTCSSDSCQGEDGKCTTGPYADCKCKNSCPTEKDDPINCAEEDCKSEDNETCKEGKYKGCKCLPEATMIINEDPDFDNAVKWTNQFMDVYHNIDKYAPKADTKKCSSSYSDAIAVDRRKVYELGEKFCADLDQSKKSKKELEFNNFVFNFEYQPKEKCYTDCKDTIHKMVCSGYDDHSIQPEGKATFKCGAEYSFQIKKKSDNDDEDDDKELDVKRTCVDPEDFKGHPKIDSAKQVEYGDKFCDNFAGKKIKDGMKPFQWQNLDAGEHVWYGYSVGWEPGCKTSVKEIDIQYPLGKDHKNNCKSLLRSAYKLCQGDNGGIGGFYRVGDCVQYRYIGFNADK